MLDVPVKNLDNLVKFDVEVARKSNIENKTCYIYFSGKFSENNKFHNTYNKYTAPTSWLLCQKKKENKFIIQAFARKIRNILVQYKKINLPFNSHLRKIYSILLTKEKKTKREMKKKIKIGA